VSAYPRAVFGIPVYTGEAHLEEAVASLLGQRGEELALVLVDDASEDATPELGRALAARDTRVTYESNKQRLGLVGNWRRAFELARERYPQAEFFAWGSDHDAWHPRWLRALVDALDAEPEALLAYPLTARVSGDGDLTQLPWTFDTIDQADPRRRVLGAAGGMVAGDMVYGLFRAPALEAAGPFPRAVMPDRLLLAELAFQGRFVQVPEALWFRRMELRPTVARQRRSLFGGSAPASARLPWWLVHAAALARAPGDQGRAARLRLAADYALISARRAAAQRATAAAAGGARAARGLLRSAPQ
jgi:glycosyltransferase involved in cell wall biosynthesis